MADTLPAETETPATEAAAPETPAVETPVSPKVAKLKEFGFEGVSNDDEAFDRLLAAYQLQEEQVKAKLDRLIEEHAPQPTAAEAAQEAQPGNWWNPPKVDESLIAQYRTADGWKEGTPADIRQQGDALIAYHDRWAKQLVHNAPAALRPAIRAEAEAIVRELLGQTQQQQQLSQFQQRVFTENPWLFETDPITGRPSQNLSAEGQQIDRYMREAQARGADYEFAWDHAITKHQAAKALAQAKQASQSKVAQETADQKRADLLRRSAPGLNRSGSLPAPSDNRLSQRNKNLSPGQRAIQIANRNGTAVH